MDNLEKDLDQLKHTHFESTGTTSLIKVPLLKTRVSSWVSWLFALVPALFLMGVGLNHYLGIAFTPLTGFYNWVNNMDQLYGDRSVINWIIRFLLLGGPLVIIFVNLLAILHVLYAREQKELIITLRMRARNILWIAISVLVFLLFAGYLVFENIAEAV